MIRVIIDIIFIILAYTAPWFVVLPLVFFAIILRPTWVELLFVSLIIDSLYAPPEYFGLHFPIATLSIVIMLVSLYMRKFIRT